MVYEIIAGMTLTTLMLAVAALPYNPYGIHVHMQDRDFPFCKKIFDTVADMGLGHIRTDCYWNRLQPKKDGPFDFKQIESIIDTGLRHGVQSEFILYAAPKWAQPEWKHPEAYRAYIRATIEKIGDRISHVEIHNEMNASCFWHGKPDPTNYVAHLKIAYETIKQVNPKIVVALGGVAGCDAASVFLEGVYAAGGKPYFDEMNVHPYVHPNPPEINFDRQIERLKALMARNGDADKPIIVSETGYPTHLGSDLPMDMIAKGLRFSDPTKKSWHVVFIESVDELCVFTQDFARHFETFMPEAKAECCRPSEAIAKIRAGGVDALVNPFSEGYFPEMMDATVDYVKNGGTLVDFGGMPMYFAMRCTGKGADPILDYSAKPDDDRKRLRIGITARWIDNNIPWNTVSTPTEAGKAAGITLPGGSFRSEYFLTPAFLKEGDEFIPLVSGPAKDGTPIASAALVKFNSDFKGKLLLSSMNNEAGTPYQPVDETKQALYLAREIALAMAEGVHRLFWFDLRAREKRRGDREHNFGVMHKDLTPKPAYHAYKTFVARRPAGSTQLAVEWQRDGIYFPQWTLPNGTPAGMIWNPAGDKPVARRFGSDKMKFYDIFNKPLTPTRTADGSWLLPLGPSPIYFEGGRIRP